MPELPEVEHLRRTLAPHIVGRRILVARLRRRDICESLHGTDLPRIRHARPAHLLEGAIVDRLERRGKQLAIVATDERSLCVQLGMTGQLLWSTRGGAPRSHTHALWIFNEGEVHFRDPRRFGALTCTPTFDDLVRWRWSSLGPDALTCDASALGPAIARTSRAIKAALLDQNVVAGVGNIYADEALFLAGIHPQRTARTISPQRVERLANAIRTVLARAIKQGGTTRRDYLDADGRAGNAQHSHAVYGRAGQACPVCTTKLRNAAVAQRTTVWCPRCQA